MDSENVSDLFFFDKKHSYHSIKYTNYPVNTVEINWTSSECCVNLKMNKLIGLWIYASHKILLYILLFW